MHHLWSVAQREEGHQSLLRLTTTYVASLLRQLLWSFRPYFSRIGDQIRCGTNADRLPEQLRDTGIGSTDKVQS